MSRRRVLSSVVGGLAGGLIIGGPESAATPASPSSFPVYDIKVDFGAIGDGVADDHDAFRAARDTIEANKAQGVLGATLIIPSGTYQVGRQTHQSGVAPYYQNEDVFDVSGLEFLRIRGEGVTQPQLRLRAGLRFGSFDPETGDPYHPGGAFYDGDYRAQVGHMIQLVDCSDVVIQNLELDGNSAELVIGGAWGDKGYQLRSAGIWVNECSDVVVNNVHTHHHAKDGITVLHLGGSATVKKQHTLTEVRSEYNARQGLSWIGGWGLTVERSQFNHTGRAINLGTGLPLVSAPGAGVDIEPNPGSQTTRDGHFYDCEMVDNVGAAMESPNADGGHTTFELCTFWATTKHSLWVNSPNVAFKQCNIHGYFRRVYSAAGSAAATTFVDCTFEDKEYGHPTRKVYRNNWLLSPLSADDTSIQGVGFTGCTFIANKTKGIMVKNPDGLTQVGKFTDCTMEHRWSEPGNGAPQTEFNGSLIQSCDFTESFVSGYYFIKINQVLVETPVGSDATNVESSNIAWGSAGGTYGDIADGTH